MLIFVNVNAYRQRKLQKAADAKLDRYRKGPVGDGEMIYSDEDGSGMGEDGEEAPEDEEREEFYIDDRYFDDDFNADGELPDDQHPENDGDYDRYDIYDESKDDTDRSDSVRKMKKRIDDNPFV